MLKLIGKKFFTIFSQNFFVYLYMATPWLTYNELITDVESLSFIKGPAKSISSKITISPISLDKHIFYNIQL